MHYFLLFGADYIWGMIVVAWHYCLDDILHSDVLLLKAYLYIKLEDRSQKKDNVFA